MIALEKVALALGEFSLRDITLHISKGEYLVVMGPSGAGKTVLLETIAGLRIPDTGKITVNQRDMDGVPPEHRGTALVYQDYSLFPHMTAFENIAFGLKMQKKPAPEIRERVDSLLADFGISSLKDRYPGSLSGGEQQRVAIARALAVRPEILLLDEPFAALDPRTREECMRMMMRVKKSRNLTILQVSHSREEAYGISDRVALIIDGSIVQTGSAEDILLTPQTVAAARYAGIENIFRGKVLSCDGTFSSLDIDGCQITIKDKAPVGEWVTIGIAGEYVSLVEEPQGTRDAVLNTISGIVTDILTMEHSVKIHIKGVLSLMAVIQRNSGLTRLPLYGEHRLVVFHPEDAHLLEEGV
jgi:ABC-type Fe3+/spermidine/putrescine transport system ATPase subunit